MKPDLLKIGAVTAGKTRTTGISPFSELEISKVYPNPDQPRKQFDDIEELATTIKEHGLLQPITVVKKDDGYMIISGERRYKAHLHNVAKTIKAHIIDVSDEAVEELTLIENIQRNDLTDFELAKHICKLWDSGRYAKKSDLATRIGKKDSFVSKAFNCLKLDTEIIDHIEQNKTPISIGVMDEIARVKDKDTQKEVFEKYNNGEITRDEIKDFKEPKKTIKQKVEDIVFKAPVACSYVEENFPRENEANEFESLKAKIQELEKEIEELNNKEVFIVGYRENKGSAIGGGFRCRALNENEAIEIAKKVRYSEIANDKNIIWEARTLKSSCNSENLFYDWVGYGFGTVNDRGTYISICQGDFKGTVLIRENGDFIKNTNDKEYRVIIKEN